MQEKSLTSREIEFDDNRLLAALLGDRDLYLHMIAEYLSVTMRARGNRVWIQGEAAHVASAETVLRRLYDRVREGYKLGRAEIEGIMRLSMNAGDPSLESAPSIATRRKTVVPRTQGQAHYVEALQHHDLVFALGPAGTGKTFLAVAMAVSSLLKGQVKRIILSRPAVEAGERLGFLPGDMKDKVDPYLRPLYDSLFDVLPEDRLHKAFESSEIEVAPLAFMRGRTLSHACVILDEAQNTTEAQMKMFLTRLGEGSRMVVTGDLTQVDLPQGVRSGLRQATALLHHVAGVGICHLTHHDIVRHPLVSRIVEAYESVSSKERSDIKDHEDEPS